MSPGKSTPSQQEPAANNTAFSIFLNRAISSWEFLHTLSLIHISQFFQKSGIHFPPALN